MKLIQIESGFKPGQVTGSNQGYGQFSPDLQQKYGIKDPNDPSQVLQGVRAERADYEAKMGRPLSDGEFYLMHQQGQAGGPALMKADPNTPAWKAVRPYYNSDAMAQKAIWGNVPDTQKGQFGSVDNVTAGQFTQLWGNRFGGGQPAQAPQQPQQVASAAPAAPAAAPASPPIFAGQQPSSNVNNPVVSQQGGGGGYAYHPFVDNTTPSPIFAPQQRPVDLSGLRQALANAAPLFPNQGNG